MFANAPLLGMYLSADRTGRTLIPAQGAPDELAAHDLDAVIRSGSAEANARLVNSRLDKLGLAIASGTVARDLAGIARAAPLGA